ncbi:MAG TPA: hypothetical protein VGR22_10725 [Thermomicrobiales bacterium]|nr:hypothetical protein [Thermomicrobiales bacterium]
MERIDRSMWRKHIRPQDLSALALVLAIALAVVVIVSVVLF